MSSQKVPSWKTRFWAKVTRAGPNKCWLWRGGVSDNGYGQFDYKGRKVGAHRMAYAAVNGFPPRGAVIRHACDTPTCCNPAHLVSGTHQQNMDDRTARGRTTVLTGAANGRTKVSDDVVARIYVAVVRQGRSQIDVAKAFGVKPSLVSDIVCRRSRRRVTEGL